MPTAREMLPAIGQTVRVGFETLTIDCQVLDVKSAYGKIRLCVAPIAGIGSQWVELSRLRESSVTLTKV